MRTVLYAQSTGAAGEAAADMAASWFVPGSNNENNNQSLTCQDSRFDILDFETVLTSRG